MRKPEGWQGESFEAELAAAQEFNDPNGEAPGGLEGTYPGGIGRGDAGWGRSWDDDIEDDDDQEPPGIGGEAQEAPDSGGYPVDVLEDDGSINTVLVVEKHSDANGTLTFTTSTGRELVQPRFAGGLLVPRTTVEAAFPGATLRTATDRYVPPAAKRDPSGPGSKM